MQLHFTTATAATAETRKTFLQLYITECCPLALTLASSLKTMANNINGIYTMYLVQCTHQKWTSSLNGCAQVKIAQNTHAYAHTHTNSLCSSHCQITIYRPTIKNIALENPLIFAWNAKFARASASIIEQKQQQQKQQSKNGIAQNWTF